MNEIKNTPEENREEVSISDKMKFWKYFLKQERFNEENESWKNLSKRFWQLKLFSMMYDAYTNTYDKKKHYYNVVSRLVSKIKLSKWLDYINKPDYIKIQKIFKQFIGLFNNPERHLDDVEKIIKQEELDKQKKKQKIKKETNNIIVETLKEEKTEEYHSMVREKEKNKLDITSSWDVVAPWDRRDDD